LHTVSVTERERLAAAARAAGLRLTAGDMAALLPAWKRYLALVEELRAAIAPGGADGDG
jgi:predicted dehydrogenase